MTARTVLVLSPDPYLAFLLERHPGGLEVILGDRELRVASVVAARTDVVVCDADDPRLDDLRRVVGPRLLVVADAGAAEAGLRVLRRPLSGPEVQHAIDQMPASGRQLLLDDPLGALGRWYPWGLVLAGLVAVVVLHQRPATTPALATGYLLAGYGLARTRLQQPWWSIADVAIACAAAITMAGLRGPSALFALVVAVGLGLHREPRSAVVGGTTIGLASAIGVLRTPNALGVEVALQTALLLPLLAALAAAGRERAHAEGRGAHDRLAGVLSELRALAGAEPGALQLREVHRSALAEVLRAAGVERGVLLVAAEHGASVGASAGASVEPEATWPDWAAQVAAPLTVINVGELPAPLRGLDPGDGQVSLVTLGDHGTVEGLVVLPGALRWQKRGAVTATARRQGVRIGNVRSFSRLRVDTVDAERRRLAGELHDSTAQVLAHVRLELELLARAGGAGADELGRLARVTGRAQDDLRQVINGLRESVVDAGLAGSLRAYVADLRSRSGPTLHFAAHAEHVHPEAVEREVFRIAQEAISNALQHAQAKTISVRLDVESEGLALTVEDDGRGIEPSDEGTGLGLGQMRERADRLGATFAVAPTPDGTRVTLRVPVSTSGTTNEGRVPHA